MGTNPVYYSHLHSMQKTALDRYYFDNKSYGYISVDEQNDMTTAAAETLREIFGISEAEWGKKDFKGYIIGGPLEQQIEASEDAEPVVDPMNSAKGPNTGHVGASASDSVQRTRPQTPPAEPEEEKGILGKIWDGVKSFFSGIWGAIKSAGSWIAGLISSDDEEKKKNPDLANQQMA